MDYFVGGVAALISGNVTPNRPKLVRKAITPIKHQQSPNVTPKSEFVDDKSIFMSPTLQKKKAIIKKSPKRIFENPDLDVTSENEDGSTLSSPKADKAKKHLKGDLDANKVSLSPKSLKSKRNKAEESSGLNNEVNIQTDNEKTPKKKKKKGIVSEEVSDSNEMFSPNKSDNNTDDNAKLNKKRKSLSDVIEETLVNNTESPKKKKKNKKVKLNGQSENIESQEHSDIEEELNDKNKSPKKKKNKKTKLNNKQAEIKIKKKLIINPNAITDKDTDSEHDSDNEIVSENEEVNKEILASKEESSDEDEEEQVNQGPKQAEKKKEERGPVTDDEVNRTLFVGNVPFSKKVKKELKKIFNKHGTIETIRIRTIPIKDQRFTPKLAMIKNELHPERSTVNVYIKYKNSSSVEQALVENNTILNDCHLRVSRSNSTGAEHDPKCSVFLGNLPFGLEDDKLREKFQSCGEIVSVRIIRDKKTNAGKGFGYVNFATKDGVELALNLTEEDLTIKNRIIRVKRCTQTQQQGKKEFKGKNQTSKYNNQNQARNFGNARNQGKNFSNARNQGKNFSNTRNEGKNFGGPQVGNEGAYRRIMNKRQNQEGGEGPPNKRPKQQNQPHKEKKSRKEFVGMTAEKKKKHTFDKGQKKKKALSEILTNK